MPFDSNVLRISDEISIKMSITIIVIFALYGIIIYQEISHAKSHVFRTSIECACAYALGLFIGFRSFTYIHLGHKEIHLIVIPFMNQILQR